MSSTILKQSNFDGDFYTKTYNKILFSAILKYIIIYKRETTRFQKFHRFHKVL